MWVFDGEEWTQDDGETKSTKPEMTRQWVDELVPELQVVEIVPVRKSHIPVPPLPMP